MKPKKALSIFAFVMVISIIITSCHGGGTTIPDGDEPQTAASDFNAEQAVTQLGFESFPDIPTLMPVGDGRVLSSYFDGESGYRLALCDIRSGKTLRDSKMKYWVSPCQPIDETNALVEIGEDFYSLDLNSFETERINVPEPFGVFNEGMSEYYYSKADTLYCKNLKSGEAFAIENEYGVGVSTVENVYSGGILSVLATTLTSAGETFPAAIDARSGKFLSLGSCVDAVNDDRFYSLCFEEESGKPYILCSSLGSAQSKSVAVPELRSSARVDLLPNSDYALVQYYDDPESSELWLLGDIVKKCSLYDCGLSGVLEEPVYLPGEGLILGSVCSETDGAYSMTVIDLKKMDFSDGCEMTDDEMHRLIDENLLEGSWECPPELAEAQEKAERIEKEFNVKILFGERCKQLIQNSNYNALLWEDPSGIDYSLYFLEEALKLYPDDFFSQFAYPVTFAFVDVADENAAAYTDYRGGRSYIVLGVNQLAPSIIFHEVWHATEQEITEKFPEAFADEEWNKLNPEGFKYAESYDRAIYNSNILYPDSDKWLLQSGAGNNAYFIGNYAFSFPKEDRATVMEEVMLCNGKVKESEHLKEKLRFMVDVLNRAFNTTGWDAPHWEWVLN